MNENYIVGRNPVLEALNGDSGVQKIYIKKGSDDGSIRKILSIARKKKLVVSEVAKEKLDFYANGANHQGVVALVSDYEYKTVEDILNYAKELGQDPFVIMLDSIEDVHNLGAIMRTAECGGAHGIIIPKRRAARVNQFVWKASAGAAKYMNVAMVNNISDTIRELKDKGLWVYAADMNGQSMWEVDFSGGVCLVIGGEDKGISQNIRNNSDMVVEIPMYGNIESLNASNAAAILIYEVLRQKHAKKR
ncbi:MAG: 23S rRNA (guanosine(2251)-2'-O)-methyltransferase RlmB [Tissierellia bacterium]|nr:23S rRNA (guanosine(2251)-2'-O)-methyltransferase RlmB [Tissierellia bacterium]